MQNGETHFGIRGVQYIRFGLIDIEGAPIEKTTIRLMDRAFEVIADSTLDKISPAVLGTVFSEIMRLTHLTEEERTKLDFTQPSDDEKSDAGNLADAEAVPTTDAPAVEASQ